MVSWEAIQDSYINGFGDDKRACNTDECPYYIPLDGIDGYGVCEDGSDLKMHHLEVVEYVAPGGSEPVCW